MSFAKDVVNIALEDILNEKQTKLELLQSVAEFIELRGDNQYVGICYAFSEEPDRSLAKYLEDQFNALFCPGRDAVAYFMAHNTGLEGSKVLSGNQMKQRRLTAIALMMAMVEAGDL